MSKYIIDSYAWIEYLEGTEQGKIVSELISNPSNEIYTLPIMVAEVLSKALRAKNKSIYKNALTALETIPYIINIDFSIGKKAGRIHFEERKLQKDFGLADAFLLASSEELKAKIVTSDPHFKNKKNIVFLSL